MKYANLGGASYEYPIGKIVCIGRNYVDHIKELGNAVPESPVLFIKPSTAVVEDGGTVVIPSYSSDCHHEVEMALLIGTGGKNIPADKVMSHIAGYGVAIDLTLRDVQAELKKKGLSWEIAKGFDTSCPLSAFVPAAAVNDPQNLSIRLEVNGEVRQNGNTSHMIHSIISLVSYMSERFTLEPGDVILTGTPAGVSPLRKGDKVFAEIDQVGSLRIDVA